MKPKSGYAEYDLDPGARWRRSAVRPEAVCEIAGEGMEYLKLRDELLLSSQPPARGGSTST